MKTVFFGGAFDPIHNGHIRLARHILSENLAQKVMLVPLFVPPHKKSHSLTSFKQRIEMLKLAVANEKNIEISDIESRLSYPSYTYKTLKRLQKELEGEIALMIGEDQLKVFDTWYEYENILKEFELIVFKRGEKIPENIKKIILNKNVIMTELSHMDISSSIIRERLEKGLNINDMVPSDVAQYIYQERLYRREKGCF